MAGVVAVLIHGAGHTAGVWRETRAAMTVPSIAVDLPGRGDRPADLTQVTVEQAAASVAADVEAAGDGPVALVAHSVAGTIVPSVAALLDGRVRHLVFVAGITADEGVCPTDVFMPGQHDLVARHLARLREQHGGAVLESIPIKDASGIDSLNFSAQAMRWAGIPDALPRTFVRCLRDPIQPRELQARFIESCGAGQVLDIDTGHTPAIDDPIALAALLDRVVLDASTPT